MTYSTFVGIVEDRLGEKVAHVDVVADEGARIVLEVPGRVGAARPDEDLAAGEDRLQPVLRARRRHGRGEGGKADRNQKCRSHWLFPLKTAVIVAQEPRQVAGGIEATNGFGAPKRRPRAAREGVAPLGRATPAHFR